MGVNMTKAQEIQVLEALGEKGAYIYNQQAAKYLTSIKQFVEITCSDEEAKPTDPYFFAKLNHRGGTYLAMLRRDHADNRTSVGRVGL
jgi:hypothetical protein